MYTLYFNSFILIRYLTIIAINKTFYLDLAYFKRHCYHEKQKESIKSFC